MRKIPLVHFWKGKPIEDCSREELLEIIDHLVPYQQEYFSREAVEARAESRVRALFA